MTTSVQVTVAPEVSWPPNAPAGRRVVRLACRMQSTHCWPTAAERRQSGQAGRPQRTQDT